MNNKGRQCIADIYLESWPGTARIYNVCRYGIKFGKMNIDSEIRKNFGPGETVIFILSESHFALHTWPEHNYISLDCYTCGEEGDPNKAIKEIIKSLPVLVYSLKNFERGF
jgi:S-adenosylmethionine decarboxylase